MARPREFDEGAVLDAAVLCFWKQGYDATSVRDLVEHTGITAVSLYNAFGDKRALYEKALKRYIEENIADRLRRCQPLPPLQALASEIGFITSDNPVVWFDPEGHKKPPLYRSASFSDPKLEITFPSVLRRCSSLCMVRRTLLSRCNTWTSPIKR